jgi:LPXTG-site transpeptidase (sortase) family protein
MAKIRTDALRYALLSLIVLLGGFVFNIFALSPLSHATAQNTLRNTFDTLVNLATAPTSERDYKGRVVAAGAPVALIEIPKLKLSEVIVEGTDSNTLRTGVGHRRDTVLPGQEGISVLFGRAWSYGGPFANLANLHVGDQIISYTGQGKATYVVTALRHAGDKGLGPVKAGTSTLVLTTAQGAFYTPSRVLRVDAQLQGKAFDSGLRVTKWAAVPPQDRELAIDTTAPWWLALSLLGLFLVEVAGLWALRRFGPAKTWLVFAPLLGLSLIVAVEQATRLLPNLL